MDKATQTQKQKIQQEQKDYISKKVQELLLNPDYGVCVVIEDEEESDEDPFEEATTALADFMGDSPDTNEEDHSWKRSSQTST